VPYRQRRESPPSLREVCDLDTCWWEVCGGHEETHDVNCRTETHDCNPHPCEELLAAAGASSALSRASLTPLMDEVWSGRYRGVATLVSSSLSSPLPLKATAAEGPEWPLLLRLSPVSYAPGWSVRLRGGEAATAPVPSLRLALSPPPLPWLSPLRTAWVSRKMPPKMARLRRGTEPEVAS